MSLRMSLQQLEDAVDAFKEALLNASTFDLIQLGITLKKVEDANYGALAKFGMVVLPRTINYTLEIAVEVEEPEVSE